ncbi:MAG TPA: hypothetical protein VH877_30165 [Polyangia bacterium]|jgi:hypothetical protein|nr:hypothetical protein [Polyangia bacterium]
MSESNYTDLDLVISDMPMRDDFDPWVGVDAITGNVKNTAVVPGKLKQPRSMSSDYYYNLIGDDTHMEQELSVGTSGKYNIEGLTITDSFSYMNSIEYNAITCSIVAKYATWYNDYEEPDANTVSLTPEALALAADPNAFRDRYGDYFVYGEKCGGQFVAVYTCHAESASSLQKFQADLGVSYERLFTQEGTASLEKAASDNHVFIEAHVYMCGHDDSPSPDVTEPDQVIPALDWFKNHIQPTAIWVKLQHYNTVYAKLPARAPVSPSVFLELTELYDDVWAIRAKYDSCPDVYQGGFTKRYNALVDGVMANSSSLPYDAAMRRDYTDQANRLLADLQDVLDRQSFYFAVLEKVAAEPEQGKMIEEKKDGPYDWLYGFQTYPLSSAVQIKSKSLHDKASHESCHPGHLTHTFAFGPDQTKLIVGWQVHSGWTDGTNGEWKKDDEQILLKNQGDVSVKSDYDRGYDWTVNFFYVDASQYQF